MKDLSITLGVTADSQSCVLVMRCPFHLHLDRTSYYHHHCSTNSKQRGGSEGSEPQQSNNICCSKYSHSTTTIGWQREAAWRRYLYQHYSDLHSSILQVTGYPLVWNDRLSANYTISSAKQQGKHSQRNTWLKICWNSHHQARTWWITLYQDEIKNGVEFQNSCFFF